MTVTASRLVGATPAAQVNNAIRSHLCVRPDYNWLHLAADVIDRLRRQPSTPDRDAQLLDAVNVITTHPRLTDSEKAQALGMAATR